MKQPKFIVYSDIHHHIYAQYNEGNRRLKVSLDAEIEIFSKAEELKIPALFIGDWLHNEKHITNELFSHILPHLSTLSAIGIYWYGITGNHDQSEINLRDKQSPSYVQTIAKFMPKWRCLDFASTTVHHNQYNLVGIPYITHDQGLLDILKEKRFKPIKGIKNILMLHTTLPETTDTNGRIIQTNSIGKREMKLIKKFDLVLVGHVHKPMKLAKNILQVGATNQQRKTDKDCNLGYWTVYDDLSFEFTEIKAPKFIELEPGEKFPDKDNYYYHRLKKVVKTNVADEREKDFKNVNNRKKIAKGYLKATKVKNKEKKNALLGILHKSEE